MACVRTCPTPLHSRVLRLPKSPRISRTIEVAGPNRSLAVRGACAGGAGACLIDAAGACGVFLVTRAAALSLADLTVANGRALQGGAAAAVGARGGASPPERPSGDDAFTDQLMTAAPVVVI